MARHASGTWHDWLHYTRQDQGELRGGAIKAGPYQIVRVIQTWSNGGICPLRSAAASPLIVDTVGMERWLEARLDLRPFVLPVGAEGPSELPGSQNTVRAPNFRERMVVDAAEGPFDKGRS